LICSIEYGDINNFIGNFSISAAELAVNVLGGLEYVGTLGGNLGDEKKQRGVQESLSNATDILGKVREGMRTPISSFESTEGFVNYASDLVANQIPSY
jgi:hypothetical protein